MRPTPKKDNELEHYQSDFLTKLFLIFVGLGALCFITVMGFLLFQANQSNTAIDFWTTALFAVKYVLMIWIAGLVISILLWALFKIINTGDVD